MKKFLIVLSSILFVFLLFSLLIYSSTYNMVPNRVEKLNSKALYAQPENWDEENTVSDSVYDNVYSTSKPPLIPFPSNSTSNLLPVDSNKNKAVYLTIDDGPNSKSTPKYLQVLKQYDVKATFFMLGSLMETKPQLVKDIDSEGHAIGNHSYTHNYSILYKDINNFSEEIIKTENVIFSLTGKTPKIFRAPGGSSKLPNPEFKNKLNELGYKIFDWNASAADTSPNGVTKKQVIDNIKRESRGHHKVIILMHDNTKRTASIEALPEIIEWFKEKGYIFKTLDENS